jgi:hypothetical protein
MVSRGERKAQPQGKANRASIQRKRNRKEPALKSSVTITVTYGLPDASAEGGFKRINHQGRCNHGETATLWCCELWLSCCCSSLVKATNNSGEKGVGSLVFLY